MSEAPSQAPAPYVAMRAAGAGAQEVFRKARGDGYKSIDCTLIIAGLFNLSFHEARQIGFAIDQELSGKAKPMP